MERDKLSRKLAVILHADVVGSTSLVHKNETLAHQRIQSAFSHLSKFIGSYNGSTREIRGDALLAEFERASDAVSAALAFQVSNRETNDAIDDEIKPQLRVGISLGEVVIADNTITGAGVVLAQRIEQLSEPDGICITSALHEAIPKHLPFEFSDLGHQELKGFADEVRVYKVSIASGQLIPPPEEDISKFRHSNKWKTAIPTAVAILVTLALAYSFLPLKDVPDGQIGDTVLPNSDRPSIAILPFDNMSNDPEQEYFIDGIAEDIITDLSQLKNLSVIARNSSFRYRNTSAKVQEIGQDLGAKYLLGGSVRKSNNRLRVNVQLVDADNGDHIWAERFDRKLIEVFELQDEITKRIVTALSIQITGDEQSQLAHSATNNFEAYDLFLHAQRFRSYSEEDLNQAIDLYRNVVSLDPEFARAYGALAVALNRLVFAGFSDTPAEMKERSLELALKAVSIYPNSPQVQWALGYVYLYRNQFDDAVVALERSISLSPSYADGYALLALIKNNMGQAEDAIRLIEKGMELNPHYSWDYIYNLGRAHYTLGHYQEAAELQQQALERNDTPSYPRIFLIASYVQLGQQEDAEWEAMQLDITHPDITLTHLRKTLPISDDELMEKLLDDLRSAGVAE